MLLFLPFTLTGLANLEEKPSTSSMKCVLLTKLYLCVYVLYAAFLILLASSYHVFIGCY